MKEKLSRANEIRKSSDESLLQKGIGLGTRTVKSTAKRATYTACREAYQSLPSRDSWTVGRTLYPLEDQDPNWTYHNEEWDRVVDRWEHRRLLQENRCLTVFDSEQQPDERVTWNNNSEFSVDVPAGKADRWVYLYLDPVEHIWRNFKWEFVVSRQSQFKELQFGFRYHDFYNRYRFRHQDSHFHYDTVLNGEFYNSQNKVPYPMKTGAEYHVTIQAIDNQFSLTVNGQTILNEVDFLRRFPRGSCAIILWEDDDITPIRAKIHSLEVTEIVPE